MERWLPVVGLEGRYEVSDQGNVRSVDRYVKTKSNGKRFVAGQPIKPNRHHKQGYVMAFLGVGKKQKKGFLVHRLVLSAFAPVDRWEELEVNHDDGNKSNNHLSNLEWCTSKGNREHACRVLGKGQGERHGRAKLTEEKVREIRQHRVNGRSQQSIADEYGVSQQVISSILRRKTWSHVT